MQQLLHVVLRNLDFPDHRVLPIYVYFLPETISSNRGESRMMKAG
jgi:hypothetical protein